MNALFQKLAFSCLAGILPAQAGLSHEVGWLPEPAGAIVAMRFADMNGDAFQDLVRLRRDAVEVLLQDAATGRFERSVTLPLGLSTTIDLRDLAIGRLDASGDAFPDVAVLWSNGDVDVLRNTAGSLLTRILPRPVQALPAATGAAIFAAEVSGDQLDDLIVLLEAVPPQYLRAQGGGAFLNVTSTNVPVSTAYPRPHATLADTDGDGDLDLVLGSTNSLPPLLLRNQSGSFAVQPGAFGAAGVSIGSVLAIDLVGTPLPEILFGRPGTVVSMPIVLTNTGGTFNSAPVTQNLRLRGVLDMARADVDRNGVDDVVFLETTGRLGYALRGNAGLLLGQPTGTSTTTETVPLLPPFPGRDCFAVADLEGDGDVDLAAGGQCPESLLLHGSGGEFYDTERFAFPVVSRATDYAAAMVDRDGNDNIDLVGLHPDGSWRAFDNDGAGHFTDVSGPIAAVLPQLSPATIWQQVFALSLTAASPGRRDLLAFGDGSAVAAQIAVLVNHGGAWLEETSTRFGGAATGVIAAAAIYPTANGRDHLVLGTYTGELEFHQNIGGTLVHQATMFPSGLGLFTLSHLIVADFSRDGAADVLALQSNGRARLLFGGPGGFTLSPLAVPLAVVGDHGTAADLDDDGDVDVLLRTTGQNGVTALRWDQANGAFTQVTLGALSSTNFIVTDMAVVRVDGAPRVVLARNDGLDVVFGWNGTGYVGPLAIPYRGTTATHGLLAADLERDGDADVLVLREGLDPAVLINETVLLQPLGPVQSGRAGDIVLGAPVAGSLAFVSFGLPRDTLTPWGLLRLDPTTMGTLFLGVAPSSRRNTWHLTLGAGLPRIRFPIQAAWITPSNQVVLSGLEHLVITP